MRKQLKTIKDNLGKLYKKTFEVEQKGQNEEILLLAISAAYLHIDFLIKNTNTGDNTFKLAIQQCGKLLQLNDPLDVLTAWANQDRTSSFLSIAKNKIIQKQAKNIQYLIDAELSKPISPMKKYALETARQYLAKTGSSLQVKQLKIAAQHCVNLLTQKTDPNRELNLWRKEDRKFDLYQARELLTEKQRLLTTLSSKLKNNEASTSTAFALEETIRFINKQAVIFPDTIQAINNIIEILINETDEAFIISRLEMMQFSLRVNDPATYSIRKLVKDIMTVTSNRITTPLLSANLAASSFPHIEQAHLITTLHTAIQQAISNDDSQLQEILGENLQLITDTQSDCVNHNIESISTFINNAYDNDGSATFKEKRKIFTLDTENENHAICIGIVKLDDDDMEFRIYNSGYGTGKFHTLSANGKRSSVQRFFVNKDTLLTTLQKNATERTAAKQPVDVVKILYETAQEASKLKSQPGKSFYAGQRVGNCANKIWNRISQENLEEKEYLKANIAILEAEKNAIKSRATSDLLGDTEILKSLVNNPDWDKTDLSATMNHIQQATLITFELKILYRQGKLAILEKNQDKMTTIIHNIHAYQEKFKKIWGELQPHPEIQHRLSPILHKKYLSKLVKYKQSQPRRPQPRAGSHPSDRGGGERKERSHTLFRTPPPRRRRQGPDNKKPTPPSPNKEEPKPPPKPPRQQRKGP